MDFKKGFGLGIAVGLLVSMVRYPAVTGCALLILLILGIVLVGGLLHSLFGTVVLLAVIVALSLKGRIR